MLGQCWLVPVIAFLLQHILRCISTSLQLSLDFVVVLFQIRRPRRRLLQYLVHLPQSDLQLLQRILSDRKKQRYLFTIISTEYQPIQRLCKLVRIAIELRPFIGIPQSCSHRFGVGGVGREDLVGGENVGIKPPWLEDADLVVGE